MNTIYILEVPYDFPPYVYSISTERLFELAQDIVGDEPGEEVTELDDAVSLVTRAAFSAHYFYEVRDLADYAERIRSDAFQFEAIQKVVRTFAEAYEKSETGNQKTIDALKRYTGKN